MTNRCISTGVRSPPSKPIASSPAPRSAPALPSSPMSTSGPSARAVMRQSSYCPAAGTIGPSASSAEVRTPYPANKRARRCIYSGRHDRPGPRAAAPAEGSCGNDGGSDGGRTVGPGCGVVAGAVTSSVRSGYLPIIRLIKGPQVYLLAYLATAEEQNLYFYTARISEAFLNRFDRPSQHFPSDLLLISYYRIPVRPPSELIQAISHAISTVHSEM
jgi:hypothetical protein